MNISSILGLAVVLPVLLSGCQSSHSNMRSNPRESDSSRNFDRKNEQTFNPVTNQYEKQPPFGPRSNKTGSGI